MATVSVRGEGGNVEEMDVPAEGTTRREIFDEMLRKGWLTIVDGDYAAPDDAEPDDDGDEADDAEATAPVKKAPVKRRAAK